MTGESFKSASIEDGMFSRTGECHLHVDGGGAAAAVQIARLLSEAHGLPAKAAPVVALSSGPQRKETPESYAEHHPAHDADPEADSFASAFLGATPTPATVDAILGTVYEAHPTAILELEQVVLDINWSGVVTVIEREAEPVDVGFTGARRITPGCNYEYHHGFNIPKDSAQPDLAELVAELTARDIPFGSIYVFDRGAELAYRTNSFATEPEHDRLVKERDVCVDVLNALTGAAVPVKTVLERVLGIWQPC